MKKLIAFIFTVAAILCLSHSVLAADTLYAANAEGELSLHISPNEESYEIAVVPACSKLTLLKQDKTWGLVEFNKKSGWINMSFTRNSYKKAALATGSDSEKKVKVSSKEGVAYLYDVPSEDVLLGSDVKDVITNDMVLEIKRETPSGWGLVSKNDDKNYAWIKLKDTTAFEEFDGAEYGEVEYVYVLSKGGKGVELWEDLGRKSYHAIIPDCTRLTVRKKEKGYAYVAYNGLNGWIDYSRTTQSLSNAQNKAGKAVNLEFVVVSEEDAALLSLPSDNPEDKAQHLGEVESGATVFVQRSTASGWCLINYDGVLGWVSSQYLQEATESENAIIQLLDKAREGYVCSEDSEGLQLYATADDEYDTSVIPECVKVRVIAEKDDYEYVVNDYAAGWAKKGSLTDTYANALTLYSLSDDLSYEAIKDFDMMSLPTNSEKCQSMILTNVKKGTDFNVIKIVETGKNEWGLTEINAVRGWVNLDNAERTEITVSDIILVVLIVAGTLFVAFAVIFILKRKNKKTDFNEKKGEEDENISNGNSIGEKESADVSGK
ncbi:MAG: SH3 domain-containing protein [Clostridia bacterium]|nr:SH3 domain-containing protein [Clostridia bacterium]